MFCLHRVTDAIPPDGLTVSSSFFRELVRMLREEFQPIPLRKLVSVLNHEEPWPNRAVVLTFDDGYEDNYTVAAPILREFGVPATFFVTVNAIGSQMRMTWDHDLPALPWMTWDMVRELSQGGFEIGSHTLTHCDLGTVKGQAAAAEIGDSKRRLEDKLGSEVRSFAYPFGGRDNFLTENLEWVKQAGYRCCCSAFGGAVWPGASPFAILRFGVNGTCSNVHDLRFDILFGRGGV